MSLKAAQAAYARGNHKKAYKLYKAAYQKNSSNHEALEGLIATAPSAKIRNYWVNQRAATPAEPATRRRRAPQPNPMRRSASPDVPAPRRRGRRLGLVLLIVVVLVGGGGLVRLG